jgi:AcrR family transcriptional regulator
MPKAFTEQEKDWIRTRLVEQGYELFATYGLKKTNIEELTQAAGISKGAFYLFYESKEALFMDVVELAEQRFRHEILEAIDQPGPSPRARLVAVFRKAFDLAEAMPILQFLTGSDFDLLYRRVPPEKFQAHLASDRLFIEELIDRCRQAGIPIQASTDQIRGLLYAMVLVVWHRNDFGLNYLHATLDLLLELVAAFCLGEVDIQAVSASDTPPGRKKDDENEPGY